MLCQFKRLIYPRTVSSDTGFMIALYEPCERITDTAGNLLTDFKAVGYCLPTAESIRYNMNGRWSRNAKHGVQFEVENYKEVIMPTKAGIIAYLSSGQIKGIGPKTAEKIYAAFGDETLNVLDADPEKLLFVPGISQKKLAKICDSYLSSRGARDIVTFLAPHGVSPNRAVKFYLQYGASTMDIVRHHPYQLCEIAGVGFRTADKIAMSIGFDPCSPERLDEGLLYTLADAETKGHLCMEKHEFIKQCLKLLGTPEITVNMAADRGAALLKDRRLTSYDGSVYRTPTAEAEQFVALRIQQLLDDPLPDSYSTLDADITAEEAKLGLTLAPEQREAVKTALCSHMSVITGGPGTGKTLIQHVMLDIYRAKHPNNNILCCAPTGRAARRMEQSTGIPAMTVHKALGLIADDDGTYCEPDMIDADLVLVDETSMMDIHLAGHLLRALPRRCQLVLIGDADQLPSVGPGAVLSEIIQCGRVPVVRLDNIYRQKKGSRIAANAKLIRHGNLGLEYGEDFQFVETNDITESAETIEELYLKEVDRCGVDNVALLSPFRQKTETGVNALNERLREKVNPPSDRKPEVTYGKRTFRLGDKVMQTRNCDDINNGDIGYITHAWNHEDDSGICVDFGDGRETEYEASDLDLLDLAYATTIHKSQGSEYQSVIVNLQCAHSIMLVRPLIYTAITRAKERVILVGERKALCIAIRKTDTEQRGTKLAARICKQTQK